MIRAVFFDLDGTLYDRARYPREALFAGDHPDIDVAGAKAAGLCLERLTTIERPPRWS